MADTRRERAKKLYDESFEYYLMDRRWQKNFRARLHNLAKQVNPLVTEGDDEIATLMYLDNIGTRLDIEPCYDWEAAYDSAEAVKLGLGGG